MENKKVEWTQRQKDIRFYSLAFIELILSILFVITIEGIFILIWLVILFFIYKYSKEEEKNDEKNKKEI